MEGREKRVIPQKTRRPAASFGTIPTCENPEVTRRRFNSVRLGGRPAFPFDDSPRRQDVRSHLEDLAQRHPEFADHLRCPPWGGEVGAHSSKWDRKQPSTESHRDEDSHSQASNSSSSAGSEGPCGTERQGGLSHHGLRNTVDIGQQQHSSEQPKESREQRSMSAPPPDNRSQNAEQAPPRYVTRLNITPLNNVENARNDQGKPPVAPKQQPTQQPQQPSSPKQSSSNVRHIPIFVEGRDEPVLPKNIGDPYVSKPPHFQPSPPPAPHSFGRPVFNTHNQFEPQAPPKTPPQSRKFQQQPRSQHSPSQPPPSPPPPPQMPQQAPPKPQPPANDPISRVMAVQKDVDELASKVDKFSGTSRKDKEYIYLDEMLTRNLLKLDDVETEGKENVRLARKEAIKSIQKCINILEGKVPLPEVENAEPMDSAELNTSGQDLEEVMNQSEGADVNQSLEDKVTEQTMEVESNESEAERRCQGSAETSEKMEVETASVSDKCEETKIVKEEPVKGIGAAEEKVMEVEEQSSDAALVDATAESVQADNAECVQSVPVEADNAECVQSVLVEADNVKVVVGTAQAELPREPLEAVPVVKPELPDVDVKESSAEDSKANIAQDVPAANPVQELVVKATEVKSDDDGSKVNESPRPKGKGTKVKKEGTKTRKGKAGKSAERMNAAGDTKVEMEPVASDITKVDDASSASQESGDLDKPVCQVADAIPTA
ncbi:hypothetical protein PR048_003261 [Dryococelus australis]|uniref:BAG domain-containing protein n=1 Tax=Dryococelus australis TaxID=614101 RepID=A0ABQ9IML7_9NEOP|nr:hypothetical protein PR048_003261 [Dryococelus australis]